MGRHEDALRKRGGAGVSTSGTASTPKVSGVSGVAGLEQITNFIRVLSRPDREKVFEQIYVAFCPLCASERNEEGECADHCYAEDEADGDEEDEDEDDACVIALEKIAEGDMGQGDMIALAKTTLASLDEDDEDEDDEGEDGEPDEEGEEDDDAYTGN